ncbi:hypothetical protein Pcinc_042602, partial [Petrolisthes cinctipes]
MDHCYRWWCGEGSGSRPVVAPTMTHNQPTNQRGGREGILSRWRMAGVGWGLER